MTRGILLLVLCTSFVLAASIISADTINSGTYSSDTWTYNVTVGSTTAYVRVYVDPNATRSMFTNVTAPSGWTETTSSALGSYTHPNLEGEGQDFTYKYFEWQRDLGTSNGTYTFSFSDNPNDSLDLVNHPGPLVFWPDSHQNAYSATTNDIGSGIITSVTGPDGYNNPITPEPATFVLVAMGLGILALKRRQSA